VSPAATATAPAQESGVPQPQTTVQPPGGPFIRYANAGNGRQYLAATQAFGGVISQPLVAVPGYVRHFKVNITAHTGSGTTTVAAQADAPYSVIQNWTLRDAFGVILLNMTGYSLKLWCKYSQGGHVLQYSDPASLGSYSAVATGASASGNFKFSLSVPLEFAKGYGTISMANSALIPSLQVNLAGSSAVYSTAPTTVPKISLRTDVAYYWLPQQQVAPPGLGSTRQAVLQVANPTIGSGANQLVTFPRLGGFIDTLILVLRDSTNARITAFPTRLRFWVDGIPMITIQLQDLIDDMYDAFQFNTGTGLQRETGVLVLTRRTSLGQACLGLLDTLETALSTNPGTLLAVEGNPWGSITHAPATLSVIAGQIIPSGQLLQGLPEI
jgi:hypothetical protein